MLNLLILSLVLLTRLEKTNTQVFPPGAVVLTEKPIPQSDYSFTFPPPESTTLEYTESTNKVTKHPTRLTSIGTKPHIGTTRKVTTPSTRPITHKPNPNERTTIKVKKPSTRPVTHKPKPDVTTTIKVTTPSTRPVTHKPKPDVTTTIKVTTPSTRPVTHKPKPDVTTTIKVTTSAANTRTEKSTRLATTTERYYNYEPVSTLPFPTDPILRRYLPSSCKNPKLVAPPPDISSYVNHIKLYKKWYELWQKWHSINFPNKTTVVAPSRLEELPTTTKKPVLNITPTPISENSGVNEIEDKGGFGEDLGGLVDELNNNKNTSDSDGIAQLSEIIKEIFNNTQNFTNKDYNNSTKDELIDFLKYAVKNGGFNLYMKPQYDVSINEVSLKSKERREENSLKNKDIKKAFIFDEEHERNPNRFILGKTKVIDDSPGCLQQIIIEPRNSLTPSDSSQMENRSNLIEIQDKSDTNKQINIDILPRTMNHPNSIDIDDKLKTDEQNNIDIRSDTKEDEVKSTEDINSIIEIFNKIVVQGEGNCTNANNTDQQNNGSRQNFSIIDCEKIRLLREKLNNMSQIEDESIQRDLSLKIAKDDIRQALTPVPIQNIETLSTAKDPIVEDNIVLKSNEGPNSQCNNVEECQPKNIKENDDVSKLFQLLGLGFLDMGHMLLNRDLNCPIIPKSERNESRLYNFPSKSSSTDSPSIFNYLLSLATTEKQHIEKTTAKTLHKTATVSSIFDKRSPNINNIHLNPIPEAPRTTNETVKSSLKDTEMNSSGLKPVKTGIRTSFHQNTSVQNGNLDLSQLFGGIFNGTRKLDAKNNTNIEQPSVIDSILDLLKLSEHGGFNVLINPKYNITINELNKHE